MTTLKALLKESVHGVNDIKTLGSELGINSGMDDNLVKGLDMTAKHLVLTMDSRMIANLGMTESTALGSIDGPADRISDGGA